MAIIIDADVIIRGERGTFDLTRWLHSRADELVEIAAITVAELWHGIERADRAHRIKRERYLRVAVEAMPVIAYTQSTALEHARIWGRAGVRWPHDWRLRFDRGRHSFGTQKRNRHIQQSTFCRSSRTKGNQTGMRACDPQVC